MQVSVFLLNAKLLKRFNGLEGRIKIILEERVLFLDTRSLTPRHWLRRLFRQLRPDATQQRYAQADKHQQYIPRCNHIRS